MSKKYTNPVDIEEVEALRELYDVEYVQQGVYLVEDWLFIYPRQQKWGHRFDNAFGYYQRGQLKEFVNKATDEYEFPATYYGKINRDLKT